jgi:hypothetical protein
MTMVGMVKRRIKWWLLLPAGCLSAGAANAQDLPSVFGLQLGAPVTLPECRRMEGMPGDAPFYYLDQAVTCAELPRQLTKSPFRDVEVHFPCDKTPEISAVNLIGTYLSKDSDKVIGIEVATPGYAAVALVIAQLTAKFGKPTAVDDDRQVVGGISVAAKHFIWKRNGFTVDYRSVDPSDSKVGALLVSTDQYDRLENEGVAADAARRTPL